MKNDKIKIVYIIDHLKKDGGAQKALYSLISSLDKKKYLPYVVCLGVNEYYAQYFHNLGIQTKVYNLNILNSFFALINLFFLLRKEKPDIVQTCLFHADIIGRTMAKLAGVPIIISSVRGFDLWKKKWHFMLGKLTAPLATKITSVSQETINYFIRHEGVKQKQIAVIHNGIDLETVQIGVSCKHLKEELDIQENQLVVGFVGRLVIDKSLDCLIKAAQITLEKHPTALFLLVGDGPLRPELQHLVQVNALNNKVKILGYREDIPQFLELFDIFVLPSMNEGLSNALLEAMAMGNPVVATDVGGNKEVVNNSCGISIPPKDEKALAQAICKLLENSDLRQAMGKSARQRVVESFSLEKTVAAYQRLYDELSV